MRQASIRLAEPSEVSVDFLQGMADRMAVSFHKYGAVAKNARHFTDTMENLKIRLNKYVADGNTEWLMDVANFCMIEFMFPTHPDAHFRATDSKESPGLKIWGGEMVQGHPEDAR